MYEAHEETRPFMDVRNYLRGVVRRRNPTPREKTTSFCGSRILSRASWRVACPGMPSTSGICSHDSNCRPCVTSFLISAGGRLCLPWAILFRWVTIVSKARAAALSWNKRVKKRAPQAWSSRVAVETLRYFATASPLPGGHIEVRRQDKMRLASRLVPPPHAAHPPRRLHPALRSRCAPCSRSSLYESMAAMGIATRP